MEIGQRIREIRKNTGLTLTELAEKIQISQPYLSQIELGGKQPPIDVIVNICKAIDIPLAEFFADEDDHLPTDILQLIETAKKLSSEEREYLNQFLQSTVKRAKKNDFE
ncbi:helix-turn-helix transcriptional regulator [Salicibibacter cibarius]|uniref:Helix-turn-helix transcriptional regulator n=1 Tax=Salicibibacter cibarius TaxID=2743000 RepID=A0A7T6Z3X0_9BACI|nr:helix-turn-helix transcriptional regulator [Salicibibacter cibarius]QQK76272.1 helix-turn-helix transcriptional regulator [Salicibibacter cibarius]